jgi:MoaA/NifB/PqqE/SkfB family radical SAM enzyme
MSNLKLKAMREVACTLVQVHLLRRKRPLFLSWNVTFACNLRCLYCDAEHARRPELDACDIISGLDELWRLGSRWITFGGGEPLLKAGIEPILEHAKRLGFGVFLSTNGTLAHEKSAALQCVDHVNLSLDGNQNTHDFIRGQGAFDKAMAAIELLKEWRVPVSILCVISKFNCDRTDEVIAIAARKKLTVMFQPATKWLNTSAEANPISPLVEPYRKTMAELIARKRAGAPIRNSIAGLRHLARWPEPQTLWCPAGRLMAVIEPDGSVVNCHQAQCALFLNNQCAKGTMAERLSQAPMPYGCAQCWCAPLVEMAMLFSLKPSALTNALRSFF